MTILPVLFMALSCKDTHLAHGPDAGGTNNTLKAGIAAYAGGAGQLQGEDNISTLEAYHFDGGKLVRTYTSFTSSDGGSTFGIDLDSRSGTLYLVALGADGPDYARPRQGDSEEAWLQQATAVAGDGLPGHFYTSRISLAGSGALDAGLERGVARFDLKIDVAGEAGIRGVIFHKAFSEVPLFPADGSSLTGSSERDVQVTFGTPLTEDTKGVAYLFGQENPSLSVSVDALVDGKETVLTAALPDKVERNTVYTLTVRKDYVSADLVLSVGAWNDGGEIEMTPGRTALSVASRESALPADVQLSQDARTITIPYGAAEFVFAVDSEDELELLPCFGNMISVEPVPSDGSSDFGRVNLFRVSKGLFAPGVPEEDVVLRFHRKGYENSYPDDTLTLRLSANPTLLSGGMDFDNPWYTYDFRRYVENELGIFKVPAGKEIFAEFEDGEDPWMKIKEEPAGSGSFRVLGGWRPNDPTADGRVQKARIVIRNSADGSAREEYTVVRRNYGLPVTKLHGVWWCKYNAIGNSRSFDHQILSSDDPAAKAGKTVFDYLGSCTADEFRELWKWAYIGDSGEGMQVFDKDGKAVMAGYKGGQTVHINKLPADALSPEGYELPTMEEFNRIFDATDYVWVMWGGNYQLKTPWEGHSSMKMVQSRKNGIQVGSLTLSDLIYFSVASAGFPDSEPLVWYGPGAQWNDEGIYHNGHYNNMLFAVHSPEGQGWFVAGGMGNLYLHKNGAGNNDTRILRFKKSDVEYIY